MKKWGIVMKKAINCLNWNFIELNIFPSLISIMQGNWDSTLKQTIADLIGNIIIVISIESLSRK